MTLTIPDDVLQQAGLTERDALVEFACHLFKEEKIELWPAARMAGMSRAEFEEECLKRRIPLYRYSPEDLRRDLEALADLEAKA